LRSDVNNDLYVGLSFLLNNTWTCCFGAVNLLLSGLFSVGCWSTAPHVVVVIDLKLDIEPSLV